MTAGSAAARPGGAPRMKTATPPPATVPPPPPANRTARWIGLSLALLALAAGPGCAPAPDPIHAGHEEVLAALPGEWQTQIQVSAGPGLLALARAGLALTPAEPPTRTAARAVRTVKVSVHRHLAGNCQGAGLLAAADQALGRYGWERVVAALEGRELAAVYTRAGADAARHLPVCVLAFDGEALVLVSAVGDLETVLALAREHLPAALRALDRRGGLAAAGPFRLRKAP